MTETESVPNVSSENENDRRRNNIGMCLFSVLNVLLISLIVITAYYVVSEKKYFVLNDGDICVPCEDLRLHPDDELNGIERRGKDKTICCVVNEEVSDVIIGYYADHWLKKKLAKGEHHKIHWDGDHEMAIVPDDYSITHHKEHGFIEIKKSGLYQIYSQIVIDHDTKADHHHHGPDIYYHSVILIEAETTHYISPREITLLKVSNTHCVSKTNKQTITSYVGGAFQLSDGDKLAVKAHNKTELVDVPHMNFFGVHML